MIANIQETYRHKGLRNKMLTALRNRGIEDETVLHAIGQIPRHMFMDTAFEELAYDLRALPIGFEQTISNPYTVAWQSSLLQLQSTDKVLEIGTGSGYQTCVLLGIVKSVYTVERQKPLYDKAKKMFQRFGLSPYQSYGDGFKGIAGFAPYDKIIVTCGAPFMPEELLKQMKIGGLMVIPVEEDGNQKMKLIHRESDVDFAVETLGEASFVPMLAKRKFHK